MGVDSKPDIRRAPRRSLAQRIVFLAAGAWVLLLIISVSLPVWFPWVLKPMAARRGITFAQYERMGWGKFVLHGLQGTIRGTAFKARRIEARLPISWYWQVQHPVRAPAAPIVTVEGWELNLGTIKSARNSGTRSAAPKTVYSQIQRGERMLFQLRHWLPHARLSAGRIRYPGRLAGILPLEANFASISWNNGLLAAEARLPVAASPLLISASVATNHAYHFAIQPGNTNANSQSWIAVDEAGATLRNVSLSGTNRLEASARIVPGRRWLERARIRGDDFPIAGKLLRDWGYRDVTGSVDGEWETNAFRLDLRAGAHSSSTRLTRPPVDLALRVWGNTNTVRIPTLQITSPGLTAGLREELVLDGERWRPMGAAKIIATADLGFFAPLGLQGSVDAIVQVKATTNRFPEAAFRLEGLGVRGWDLVATNVQAAGSFQWPRLALETLQVKCGNGSRAGFAAEVDLKTRTVIKASWNLAARVKRGFLPGGFYYDIFETSGTAAGPITNLAHTGRLDGRQLMVPGSASFNTEAEWGGHLLQIDRFSARAASARGAIAASGSGSVSSRGIDFHMKTLALETSGAPQLALAEPCSLSLKRFAIRPLRFDLRVDPLRWVGAGRRVDLSAHVRWPESGAVTAEARNLGTSLLQPFAANTLPLVDIAGLSVSSSWTNSQPLLQFRTVPAQTREQIAGIVTAGQAVIPGSGPASGRDAAATSGALKLSDRWWLASEPAQGSEGKSVSRWRAYWR